MQQISIAYLIPQGFYKIVLPKISVNSGAVTDSGNGEGAGKRKNFPRLSQDPCKYLPRC